MKIFIAGAFKSSTADKARLEMLISHLKNNENKLDTYLFDVEQDSDDYQDVLSRIRDADIFIGEMSRASQTLGFLLAYAISHQKPSLYIYDESTHGKPKSPILDNPSRLLAITDYSDENISDKLKSFLTKAKKQLYSQRITFICSKEIYDYIETKSNESGMSKGEMIRSLLEKSIDLDKINNNKVLS